MRIYHRTDAADAILTEGFRESLGVGGADKRGVYFADVPVDANEGAKGWDLLGLNIPEDELREHEIEQYGVSYREFIVPLALIRKYGPPDRVSDKEEEEAVQRRFAAFEGIDPDSLPGPDDVD